MSDERIAKLPTWARELIADLRRRVEYGNEPLLAEVARSRPRIEKLERENGALRELLDCAARGGHKEAAEIVEVIRGYGLELVKES